MSKKDTQNEGRQMTSRIPVTEDMHQFIHNFKNGLGKAVTYDDVLYFAMSRLVPKGEHPYLAAEKWLEEFSEAMKERGTSEGEA